MTDPTGLDLDALERLCEAARVGPWRRGQTGNLRIYAPDGLGARSGPIAEVFTGGDAPGTAAFIAAARTALPQALATIRARDEEVRQLNSGYDIVERRCIDRGHKLAAAQARVAELDNALSAVTARISGLQREKLAAQARVAELEAENAKLKTPDMFWDMCGEQFCDSEAFIDASDQGENTLVLEMQCARSLPSMWAAGRYMDDRWHVTEHATVDEAKAALAGQPADAEGK